jgi:TolB protein
MPPLLDGKYTSGKRKTFLFRERRRAPFLPVSLIVLAVIILAFSLIQPPQLQQIANINPRNITVPPPTATATALPRPTDVHGGHIVFTCTRGSYNQICMINADGSGFRQLTNDATNSYYPAISPEGNSIVYASNRNGIFDLFEFSLANSQISQLTYSIGNVVSPSFSPDGKQIVFVNRVGDQPSALWLMDKSGRNPHVLYQGPKDIVGAAWSPDGKTIAFAMSVDVQFSYQIFLLDVQNPNVPRQITQGRSDIGGSLAWSPDSKSLLIFAGPVNGRRIFRLDLTNGAVTQLTFDGNSASAFYSPDGQYIVYNSIRNSADANLYIMRADGHSTRQLTQDSEPDWQPQWGW